MDIRGNEEGALPPAEPAERPSAAQAIREGLLVQRRTGTVSAVEYLKSNGVGSATIRCVLSKNLAA